MQKQDPEATASLNEALADVRTALFVVAHDANRLGLPKSASHVVDLLQTANYNLGQAERELAAA